MGIEGTVLVDERGEMVDRWAIRGVPTNLFVDAAGTVTEVGGVTLDELEAAARRLLGPGAVVEQPRARASWWYEAAGAGQRRANPPRVGI
ncbi:MAG: TlpA family protein disulfide reductase [Acidimicrobiales bacterium]